MAARSPEVRFISHLEAGLGRVKTVDLPRGKRSVVPALAAAVLVSAVGAAAAMIVIATVVAIAAMIVIATVVVGFKTQRGQES